MKINKSIGMILLAVYLIIDGLLGFGIKFGPAIFLLYLVALAAGVFISIGNDFDATAQNSEVSNYREKSPPIRSMAE